MTKPSLTVAIAHQLLGALATRDWAVMRCLLAEHVCWSMPGSGAFHKPADGIDAVIERAQQLAASGVRTELQQVLVGARGVALLLRNTGERADGRNLDEHLAVVLTLDDDRISAIDSYLSDIGAAERFFA